MCVTVMFVYTSVCIVSWHMYVCNVCVGTSGCGVWVSVRVYYGGCVWECLGRERLWRRSVLFDMLLEILSVNRFEIVLLPRGCYTKWLVIFTGTNFYDTGQNSILEIFALGKSGTHKLGSCMTKS